MVPIYSNKLYVIVCFDDVIIWMTFHLTRPKTLYFRGWWCTNLHEDEETLLPALPDVLPKSPQIPARKQCSTITTWQCNDYMATVWQLAIVVSCVEETATESAGLAHTTCIARSVFPTTNKREAELITVHNMIMSYMFWCFMQSGWPWVWCSENESRWPEI